MTRLGTTNRYGFRSRLRLTQTQTASGTPTNIAVKDLLYTSDPGATFECGGYIEVQHSPGYLPTFESSDVAKATVGSTGLLTRVGSGGTVAITTTLGPLQSRHQCTISEQTNATLTYAGFATGSLLKATNDAIDTLIAGVTPATAKPIFTAQNPYTRNASCWAASLDLTGISPRNSQLANKLAGTLVTPRHALFARHYQPTVGATMDFVTADGTAITRTIADKASLSGSNTDYATDVTVVRLDSDLPGTIKPYKILPANTASYLASPDRGLPVMVLDQEEKALVYEWRGYGLGNACSFRWPTTYERALFAEQLITGDSGNPIFLVLNGEPVLLSLNSATAFNILSLGPNLMANAAAINGLIVGMGNSGGYQLTTADLSGFTSYA